MDHDGSEITSNHPPDSVESGEGSRLKTETRCLSVPRSSITLAIHGSTPPGALRGEHSTARTGTHSFTSKRRRKCKRDFANRQSMDCALTIALTTWLGTFPGPKSERSAILRTALMYGGIERAQACRRRNKHVDIEREPRTNKRSYERNFK